MKSISLFLISLSLLSSCSTRFTGDAHLTPQKCEAKCIDWGMSLDGMVAMGEYSDACICTKKSNVTKKSGAARADVVGVILQMQAEEKPNQSYSSNM